MRDLEGVTDELWKRNGPLFRGAERVGLADREWANTWAKVLREHYPERLNEVWIWDAPLFFSAMWQAVSQFIKPGTREKVRFARGKNGQRSLLARFGDSVSTCVEHC